MGTKKFWTGMIIAAVISLVMVIAGFLMGGGISDLRSTFVLANRDSSMTDVSEAGLKNVKNINISTKYCNVKVQYGDGNKIEVSSGGDACDKYVKGDTLYIGYSDGTEYTSKMLFGNYKLASEKIAGQGVVSITLPDSLNIDQFNVTGKHTDFDASLIKAKSFNVNIDRGDLSVDDLETDSAQIETKHCPVRAGKIMAGENCSIIVKGGSVDLGEDSDTVNNINGLAVQTGSGDINIHSKVIGTAQIISKHGNIHLTLNGSDQSYSITGSYSNSTAPSSDTYGSLEITGKEKKISVDYDNKVK